MNKDRIFIILYMLIAFLVLLAAITGSRWLHLPAKPLIMISLLGWAVLSADTRSLRRKPLLLAGLVFAWIGDVFLMFDGFFLHGLAAFLVMQVLYIFVFSGEIRKPLPLFPTLLKALLLITALGIILMTVVPHLSDAVLRIAVPVYAFTITVMTFAAFLRNSGVSSLSFRMVTVGAVFFMISDTLIALNAFVGPVVHHHFWIMSTYMIAQFSIVRGMLKVR